MPVTAPHGARPPARRSSIHRFAGAHLPVIFALAVALGGADTAAEEAGGTGLARCPTLDDALTRLSCYDAAVRQTEPRPTTRAAFTRVDLIDFKADRDAFLSKRVQVSGRFQIIGLYGTLRSPDGVDTAPVWVRVDRLKPERQKEIEALCAHGCSATVSGRVGYVFTGTGIAAEAIEVAIP